MRHYVNPGSRKFKMSLNSEIYVDKSNLIAKTNAVLDTEDRFICISRPRRFGKTMAANMLAAYYGIGEDTNELFQGLNIAKHPSYEKQLNKHNVIMVNMQAFLSRANSVEAMLVDLQSKIMSELKQMYPNAKYIDENDFTHVLADIFFHTNNFFVILIDEWDCVFRASKLNDDDHEIYLDFLRLWLKDQSYVGLAYMTGILPIKKYGDHSALNMFNEFSMVKPYHFIDYFGFKDSEVEKLSKKYKMDFDEIRKWYNGYFVDRGQPIYNPRSVKSCLLNKEFDSYWTDTETYEALKDYIKLNFEGLKNKIAQMISGYDTKVNPNKFTNDMITFNSVDDVLTLLVHLGYLTYSFKEATVRIPNEEVKGEFINSIEDLADWDSVVDAIDQSQQLLHAIWNKDANVVAEGVQKVHEQNTSILKYNDENALSCVISLALYSAKNYYTTIREFPSGKGDADLVFVPYKKSIDKPALVVELKWNKTVEGAIAQIKKKNYLSSLEAYQGDLLLVGINYEKETKHHECVIESWEM